MPRFETVKVPSRSSSGRSARRARGVREAARLGGDLRQRLRVGVEHDRDEQRVVERDRDPDVDARVLLDPSVDVGRVEPRQLAQRRGGGLDRRSR